MRNSECDNNYFKQFLTETDAASMAPNTNQIDFNIIYEAWCSNEGDTEYPLYCLEDNDFDLFCDLLTRDEIGYSDAIRSSMLLKSAIQNAPIVENCIGPIYGESISRKEVYIRYIHDEIIDALDGRHSSLLQVHRTVEKLVGPIIKGRSDDRFCGSLTIPEPLQRKLLENGQQQLFEFKKSSQKLDLKPIVKLYRADGAGTWLLSEMHEERPDMAIGLCDRGGGHTAVMEISLSELQEHACKPLFAIELDDSFAATKTIAQYAEQAQLDGKLIV